MAFWVAVGSIAYGAIKVLLTEVSSRMGESSNTEKLLGIVNGIGEEKFAEGLAGLGVQKDSSEVKEYIADLSDKEAEDLFNAITQVDAS
jgi:hypothetical protein